MSSDQKGMRANVWICEQVILYMLERNSECYWCLLCCAMQLLWNMAQIRCDWDSFIENNKTQISWWHCFSVVAAVALKITPRLFFLTLLPMYLRESRQTFVCIIFCVPPFIPVTVEYRTNLWAYWEMCEGLLRIRWVGIWWSLFKGFS